MEVPSPFSRNEESINTERRDSNEPLVIIGYALEYPQDAGTAEGFWKVLVEKRDVMTEWPSDRINLDAFAQRDEIQEQKKSVPGAHFVKGDLGAFDAPFFGISATEAKAMDIQQRKLLEITYHAFENAGIPMERVHGSKTGVYSGSMSDDYSQILSRDIDDLPKYTGSGVARTMLANRISWFYNLHGPSISLDSACSSSLMAFDFACQGLRNGDCDMAIVTGSSVVFAPDGTIALMNMSFLSPRGRCHSFDERADGYSRGEGFGTILLKPLSKAIRDNNTIRAVVRSTGSNQDGHTPGLTQPSREMQAALIRDTYNKAGLSFSDTRFFEAHGTGTPIGDPIEADAIGSIFRTFRAPDDPLYVGALKANVGHLEGGSGVAGVIKAVMVLEKGIIPPNANFEKPNPRIDWEFLNMKFPTECTPWPGDGLRRASVASFGFGGSNSHAVLDDAYNYMKTHGLKGLHSTSPSPPPALQISTAQNSESIPLLSHDDNGSSDTDSDNIAPLTPLSYPNRSANGVSEQKSHLVANNSAAQHDRQDETERLLVLSAADEQGIRRLAESYENYVKDHQDVVTLQAYLDHLAYSLSARRSSLAWKSFAVVDTVESLRGLGGLLSKPVATGSNAKNVFVFTGQGAQYRNMGSDLLAEPVFREKIELFDQQLAMLGSSWSVANLLQDQNSATDIDDPEYSQTMTTAIQIALYDLLRTLGIHASVVVGHSSGEIAAAYTAGALSLDAACRVSYFRGKCASALKSSTIVPGAMLSVDLPEPRMRERLEQFEERHKSILSIACINSPRNVTISGDEAAIDAIMVELSSERVNTRKLKTGVAYHSPHMHQIAQSYAKQLGKLERGAGTQSPAIISSVSGNYVRDLAHMASAEYWMNNMIRPVQFCEAMSKVSLILAEKQTRKLGTPKVDAGDVVEIGPHSALRRPVIDCLEHNHVPQSKLRYHNALSRTATARTSILKLAGELYTRGYPVNIQKVNEVARNSPIKVQHLHDLPSYPFNHSRIYWHESAIGKHLRSRLAGQHELLGAPVPDWNPEEPRWRKFFSVSEMPWIEHHQVNNRIIYPAAGMVVMAIQGALQVADTGREIAAYQILNATFTSPLTIDKTEKSEAQLYMRLDHARTDKNSTSLDFRVYSAGPTGWFRNCSGSIQILYHHDGMNAPRERENRFYQEKYVESLQRCTSNVPFQQLYDRLRSNGLQFGSSFQTLSSLAWDDEHTAVGEIQCLGRSAESLRNNLPPHVIHPTVLDGLGQLPWLVLTKGGSETVVNGTAVTRIRQAWISSTSASSSRVRACCTTSFKGLRGTDSSGFALDAAGNMVLRVSHMETTAIGGDERAFAGDEPRKIGFGMVYKPDVTLLDQGQLLSLVNSNIQIQKSPASFYEDLDLALFYFAVEALREVPIPNGVGHDDRPHIDKYVTWLKRQIHQYHEGKLPHSRSDWKTRIERADVMDQIIQRLQEANDEGKFFVHVGRNLRSIIQGSADPLEVLFRDGLAERHYQAMCDQMTCCKQLVNYMETLSHKNPQLRILEVGAGTGSITGHVLQGLGTHFRCYDYTDVSETFFEQAREKFASSKPRINYSLLNLETDIISQGYEAESYDVVVAAWVLHATRDLAATIRNIRRVLKPGGKLVMLEITEPDLLRNGIAFGTLPGWWLGTEPEREWSPCISGTQWSTLLAANGFQGVDIALPDYDSESCHESAILIATAKGDEITRGKGIATHITAVVAPNSALQMALAKSLQMHLQLKGPGCLSIITLGDEALSRLQHGCVVFMAELDQPYLSSLDESSFRSLQDLLMRIEAVIWLTSAEVGAEVYPELQMIRGFARALSSEKPGLALVSLSFESPSINLEVCARLTGQVITQTLGQSSDRELEYAEQDGILTINRVFDSEEINHAIHSRTHTMIRHQAVEQSPPLHLTVQNSGLLDSVRWEEDPKYQDELLPDEIEIEVRALGVNFRDLLVILGKLNATSIGYECAGTVTRVGANCNTLKVGDNVCACIVGCSNTHARCHYQLAIKIPDFLSMAEAASLPITGVTAYYSLVTLSHLEEGESILIHGATGGTGQMMLQIAQSIGAEIFVTVGTDEKRRLVKELYNIDDDHIFNSRDTSFARDLYCATGGKGVDVVVNTLSNEALRASWECIAPFGRFIELGKRDIEDDSKLPMARFSKNVSFFAVSVDHLVSQRPLIVRKTLQAVLDMIGQGKMKIAYPLHLYYVSDLVPAFRVMQSGKLMGKIVLTLDPSDKVPTWLKPRYACQLNPNATYLIAGGLGGLGRSAALWMAQRGARNLVLLSRSGPVSVPAQKLLSELQSVGVTVRTPTCDISDSASLASALEGCLDMPPIEGCLQATMVLQDALFEKMTWEQWSISIRSKVKTTWNLHNQLPKGMSFFVILSSAAGIVGSIGQSNYAAGNTFQDALAAHRIALGERAISIDLGWMEDIGAVAENAALTRGKEVIGDLAPIHENEFLALMDRYCDPNLEVGTLQEAQPIIGLATSAQFLNKGLEPPDWLTDRPFLKGLTSEAELITDGTVESGEKYSDSDWVQLLRASSPSDATNVIVLALTQRLAKATSTPPEEIDRTRPLHTYGVDSLLAVELRNWFEKQFKADVAIFDITSQASLEKIAEKAANSSALLKPNGHVETSHRP